jgi:hypothetical protein
VYHVFKLQTSSFILPETYFPPFTYNLEVNASQIYHCIRKKNKDEFILGMFKAISKVELKHAEFVDKLINKDPGCEIHNILPNCIGIIFLIS